MNTTAKVILFPQLTSKGYPLKLRITQKRKSSYISLKYYLSKTDKARYWNSDTNELRKSYPHFEQVQAKVDEILKTEKIELNDEESVKTYLNSRSFSQYMDERIFSLEATGKFGSVQKLRTVKRHLEAFREGDILFSDITIDFLEAFKVFLYKKKIKPISQKAYFERIRRLINNAIKADKYNPRRHPFLSFDFETSAANPKALSPLQLKQILAGIKLEGAITQVNLQSGEKEILKLSARSADAGRKFAFQYFAYGMRVSDLILLKWRNFYENGTRLKYRMFKTKKEIDILLTNKLLRILFHYLPMDIQLTINKRYKENDAIIEELVTEKIGETTITRKSISDWYHLVSYYISKLSKDQNQKNCYVFKMLPDVEMDDRLIYSRVQTNTSYYNKNLKILSNELHLTENIDFQLSSHTARHTFAYIAVLEGKNTYYISKALNHKSIAVTEKYLTNFKTTELDNKFYDEQVNAEKSMEIDERLRELLKNADNKKKMAIIKLLEDLQ